MSFKGKRLCVLAPNCGNLEDSLRKTNCHQTYDNFIGEDVLSSTLHSKEVTGKGVSEDRIWWHRLPDDAITASRALSIFYIQEDTYSLLTCAEAFSSDFNYWWNLCGKILQCFFYNAIVESFLIYWNMKNKCSSRHCVMVVKGGALHLDLNYSVKTYSAKWFRVVSSSPCALVISTIKWSSQVALSLIGLLNLKKKLKIAFIFWPHLRHMEVLCPGIKSEWQLWPSPQLWQCQLLNPLCHSGNSIISLISLRYHWQGKE